MKWIKLIIISCLLCMIVLGIQTLNQKPVEAKYIHFHNGGIIYQLENGKKEKIELTGINFPVNSVYVQGDLAKKLASPAKISVVIDEMFRDKLITVEPSSSLVKKKGYVFINKRLVQEWLVSEGLAVPFTVNNDEYTDIIRSAYVQAKKEKKGMFIDLENHIDENKKGR